MLFSSMTFLWVFLPVVLLLGNLLPRKAANGVLVAASLLFYAWGEPVYVLIMLVSILFNWACGLAIARAGKRKKALLVMNIAGNLLGLVYFKYLGLLLEALGLIGLAVEPVSIALPIGISFFTFQALSYVVDVYRGEVACQKSLWNVALYISFFPQLIAGPIVRYKDIERQIAGRRLTAEKFQQGIRRFVYGLGKKVLIANVVAQTVDAVYALDLRQISGGLTWLAAILYALQIYYDFSGYSDMAIGLGKMFGFDFEENFRYPYVSRSVREFWRRWHISLGTWFREYVYIPLGGNRRGKGRTYLNLLAVFFLTGLWHGAGLSFIVWGLYHGFFQILERLGLKKWLDKCKPVAWLYTMGVVVVGWVIFRVEDLLTALILIKRMLVPWQYLQGVPLMSVAGGYTLFMAVIGLLGTGFVQKALERFRLREKWQGSLPEVLWLMGVLILSMAALAADSYNPFIYFQF